MANRPLLEARPGRGRAGFTLIEMLIVVMILAVLAGLLIPQFSTIGRTVDMAASATTQADLANNLQTFFLFQKRFPQYMDSLIDTSGALYGPDNTDANLQTKGLPASSPKLYADLQVEALTNGSTPGTADYLRSFQRCGFDFVMDHDLAVINSNISGNTPRAVNTGSSVNVATVKPAAALVKAMYPGTQVIPANSKLVALGVGPSNTAIPKTMLQAPVYPGCDGKYYGRYVAIFQVYASGERATLVGVVDPYGRWPDYTIQQYNESLPDGARQG